MRCSPGVSFKGVQAFFCTLLSAPFGPIPLVLSISDLILRLASAPMLCVHYFGFWWIFFCTCGG